VRLVAFIEYAAVVIGIVVMIAGHFFRNPKFFHLGVFLFGAGFAFAGLMALFTRRMAFRPADDAFEAYAGLPALIVGLMALAVGVAAIWSAYLLDLGQWHATVNSLTRRPAPVLAVGGLFCIGIGILMLLNPQGHHSWAWRLLVYAPRSTIGVLVIAAGVASLVLGAWEWRDPQAFQAFGADLPRKIRLLY
jgi:hypothetical protein